jgi:hypothetical protein
MGAQAALQIMLRTDVPGAGDRIILAPQRA